MGFRRARRPITWVAAVAVVCGGAAHAASLEIKVAQGRLAGAVVDGGVRVYRGIPYAAPPVGDLRWCNPQPPAAWNGVRDATQFAARCVQNTGNSGFNVRAAAAATLPMSEDCLYLNVWTGVRGARERRPVAVWLHGGSFMIGTGAIFDGAALARRGVVVVTINYSVDPAPREAFRDETAWLAQFFAAAHARPHGGHTWLYYFSHRPPAPAEGPYRGATHAAEVSYVFATPAPNWRDEDRRVADVMSAYWANFVTRGDPNGPGLPAWPEFAGGGPRMDLGPMSPAPGLDAPRLAVFDVLYRRLIQRSGE